MPPSGGHLRPNNMSNPYNHFPQQQHPSYQPHTTNFSAQAFNGHGGFPTQPSQQANIFGGSALPSTTSTGSYGAGMLQNSGGTGLASHEAQLGFAHGAALQRQHAGPSKIVSPSRIREVWKDNFDREMATIRALIDKYPYISMDTEFPGVVARPMGDFPTKTDYHYQCLRTNVDMLNVIQVGLTLWSSEGDLPPAEFDLPLNRQTRTILCPCTWTFNLRFSLEEDMFSADSIALLQKSGLAFDKHATMGIDHQEFGARLHDSGLVLSPNVTWLSFHSAYDFGYLVKVMSQSQLPEKDSEYTPLVTKYFRRVFDVKFLLRQAQTKTRASQAPFKGQELLASLGQKGGLQDLANELGCSREGQPHTAGSDSLLTGQVFFALRAKLFDNEIPDDYINKIWGLYGVGPPAPASVQSALMHSQQQGGHVGHSITGPDTPGAGTPSIGQPTLTSTPGQRGYGGAAMGMSSGGAFNFLYGTR